MYSGHHTPHKNILPNHANILSMPHPPKVIALLLAGFLSGALLIGSLIVRVLVDTPLSNARASIPENLYLVALAYYCVGSFYAAYKPSLATGNYFVVFFIFPAFCWLLYLITQSLATI